MVRHEGARWDVGTESNAVHVERISDSDKRLFDDLLAPEEARELAGLLTKYADKLDESRDSDRSADSDDAHKSENSDKPDKSDSHTSDSSDTSEGSDTSEESDDSDKSSD
jgi:hypothetical protein